MGSTWSILAYISDELNYKRTPTDQTIVDLPNITLEIGLGREKKTIINIFYREWTSGVSGLSSHTSQVEGLTRQIIYWKSLYRLRKAITIMGDANLDALKWNEADYNANNKTLANLVQEYLLEESSQQVVQDFTRSEMSNNFIHRSCIDHIYTNASMKAIIQ